MKDKFRKMSITNLFAARQWLIAMFNNPKIPKEYAAKAMSSVTGVDKELWAILIDGDTPWGEVEGPDQKSFADDKFDYTLEKLREGGLDASGDEGGSSGEEDSHSQA